MTLDPHPTAHRAADVHRKGKRHICMYSHLRQKHVKLTLLSIKLATKLEYQNSQQLSKSRKHTCTAPACLWKDVMWASNSRASHCKTCCSVGTRRGSILELSTHSGATSFRLPEIAKIRGYMSLRHEQPPAHHYFPSAPSLWLMLRPTSVRKNLSWRRQHHPRVMGRGASVIGVGEGRRVEMHQALGGGQKATQATGGCTSRASARAAHCLTTPLGPKPCCSMIHYPCCTLIQSTHYKQHKAKHEESSWDKRRQQCALHRLQSKI